MTKADKLTPGPWHAVKLDCYVAPRLSEWFVCRTLPSGHVEHLCHASGRPGVAGTVRHFKNEGDARRAALAQQEEPNA